MINLECIRCGAREAIGHAPSDPSTELPCHACYARLAVVVGPAPTPTPTDTADKAYHDWLGDRVRARRAGLPVPDMTPLAARSHWAQAIPSVNVAHNVAHKGGK